MNIKIKLKYVIMLLYFPVLGVMKSVGLGYKDWQFWVVGICLLLIDVLSYIDGINRS